ncbi:MAG: lysophospholipid acyltransferase family protein [Gemmatimonadota bacterium]
MIRTIRYWLAVVLATGWYGGKVIVSALAGVRQVPGGVYDRSQQSWARMLLRWTGVEVDVVHAERIEPGRGCVYISNHTSWLDIWALLDTLPGIRFVFKKQFLYIPVLGTAMRRIGHIAVDRAKRHSAVAAYDAAAGEVRAGTPAVVFAEGTRSRDGRLHPFKRGPFVLAITAQVPVVPVFCEHTFALLPKGALAPRPGTIRVHIGEPIPTAGLTYEARDTLSDQAHRAVIRLGATQA